MGAGVIPELKTDRLLLRGFRQSDFDAHAAMCADPEVMKHMTGAPLSAADAWRQMAMFAGHWTLRGYGIWAVEECASGAFVGRIGLYFPEGWPDRELGWALARQYWGQGFATEACSAALRYAFDTLEWDHVISLISPDNVRSAALAKRLGAHAEGVTEVLGHHVDIYKHTRASRPDLPRAPSQESGH